jgi:tRNA(fMet)-specific endonuclease VapC
MTRRYILDANAIGDLVHTRRGVDVKAEEARRKGAKIGTCTPIWGEFLHGIELSQTRDRNMKVAQRGIRTMTIWPFDVAAAEEFGRLAALLKRIGRPMQIPDIQLAAVAFTLGDCTVVSSDTDLLAVPGLTVENWAAA